jgi:hypothetical protein
MPCAVVARSAPTIEVTLMAMLTVTGPRSATKSANCANANGAISFQPAGSVGAGMRCGISTAEAAAWSAVGRTGSSGAVGVVVIRDLPQWSNLDSHLHV